MKKTGLTLGKFAPLHKGHEFLIETGLQEMDELIIVVYDSPDQTSIPLPVRAAWIRQLFPTAEVLEAWDGPSDYGDTPEIMRKQETFILELLKGRNVTHFYSSEFYGEHMSIALNAENRIVDAPRSQFPVSATAIKANPYQNRAFISPVVYRDLIANVVFLGAPSTGKTTVSKHAAAHYHTTWMPEYGREYWEGNQVNRRLSLEQLTEIATGHLEREEDALLQANQFLFTDTDAITTYVYSLYYHGTASAVLTALAQQAEKRYDLFFLCDTDIPYEDTWDRSGDVSRKSFQKRIITELNTRKIQYFILSGTVEERMAKLESILSKFRKYTSILEMEIPEPVSNDTVSEGLC